MTRIAADRYAQIYRIIKSNDPTAKVFCCGNFDFRYSEWLADFLQQLRLYHSDVKIDGLAIHAYPWGSSVPFCWNYGPTSDIWQRCMAPELAKSRNDFRNIGAPLVPDAPLWITETGYLGIPTVASPPLTVQASATVRDGSHDRLAPERQHGLPGGGVVHLHRQPLLLMQPICSKRPRRSTRRRL
ncbi:MAG: hypothetical protein V9H69_17695 [Anaerolineae bacterium]